MNIRVTGSLALLVLAWLAPACSNSSDGGGGGGSFTTPGWVNQQRTPTASHLNGASFVNALQGIIVGEATSIYRTDDGGITWMQQEHNPKSGVGDILCMDAMGTTVHSGGSDATGGRVWITDNTIEWYTGTAPGIPPIIVGVDVVKEWDGITTSIAFYMRQNGEIVPSGAAYTTTRAPFPGGVGSTGARAIDYLALSGYGYVCGVGGYLFKTNDFGNSWSTSGVWQTVTYPMGVPTYSTAHTGDLRDLWMLTAGQGVAVGSGGALLDTMTGDDWRLVTITPIAGQTLLSVIMVNGTTGWACGTNGTIVKLTATAQPAPQHPNWSWSVQTSNTTEQLNDISFVDVNTGYAVGQNGTVVKTTNGGTNWNVISGGSTAQINAMDFTPDGQRGLAVGNGGVVLRTTNGGTTWSPMVSGVVANLHGVCIPRTGSGNVGYICGAGGTIRRNIDFTGVGVWEAPTVAPPVVIYRAVLFPGGDSTGVFVGDGPTIRRTTTGADPVLANWLLAAPTTSPSGTAHYSLASNPGGTTIYVAGAGSNIGFSSDGGDVWADVLPALGVGTTINSIQAPSGTAYTLFATASNNNVYRLTAGMTPAWQTTTPLAANTPVGIAFVNDTTGWAVLQGAAGGVYRTDDSGTSWSQQPEHTKSVFTCIRMISSSTGWTGANDGTILKTTSGGY